MRRLLKKVQICTTVSRVALFYIISFSTASDRKCGGMQSTDDFKGKSGYRMHVFAVYGYGAFKNQKASFVFLC